MTPPPSDAFASPESLLAHAGWVRDLARRLVSDPHLADELEQDTWVAALGDPPRADGPPRAWLGTVMRNFLRQRLRGEGRRTRRERAGSEARAAETQPGTDEVTERVGMHRRVVDQVLDLSEPYRSVLLLRYFDELTPSEIASRTGVPVSTVKTQLARAIERLRARMDRELGDRETWTAALAPLLAGPLPGVATSGSSAAVAGSSAARSGAFWKLTATGVSIVNAKLFLLGAVLVAAGGLTAIEVLSSRPGNAVGPDEVEASAAELAEPSPLPVAKQAAEERAPVSERRAEPAATRPAPSGSAAPAAAKPAPRRARGRLLDAEGRALVGMNVRFRTGDATAATGEDGTFELEVPGGERGSLVIADPGWTTVLSGIWERHSNRSEAVVVAAPLLALGGVARDDGGRRLSGVHVDFVLPDDFRGRFRAVLDYSAELGRSAASGEDGRFELEVPDVRGARLRATKEGHEPWVGPSPKWSTPDLELVLSSRTPEGQVVRGIVIDEAGNPVGGARVSLSFDTTTTADDGTFALETARADGPNANYGRFIGLVHDTVLAVAPGRLPARFVTEQRDQNGGVLWPEWVELVLGPPPLSIGGRVVDGDGAPRPSVRVWVADPMVFGVEGDDPIHVETLLAERNDLWSYVETDADGRFRIDGLLDRAYELQVMDPETLERVVRPGVEAGRSDVRIALECETFDVLRGRVIDGTGAPVPNVRTAVFCDAFVLRYRGSVFGTRHALAGMTITDEEGRFEFHRVPKTLAYLRFDGEDTMPLSLGREHEGGLGDLVGEDGSELEVTVSRRCHFQLEIDPEDVVDAIRMLDGDGAVLSIDQFVGNGRKTMDTFPVSPGQTATLAVSDAARELVLLSGDVEVRRVPVTLAPSELTVLQP